MNVPTVWYDFGFTPVNVNEIKSLSDFERQPGIRAGGLPFWDWLDLKQLGEVQSQHTQSFSMILSDWFTPSRTIHDRNLIGIETEAIDEFPAFSFLLGDLHPHVLGLPFVLLAIGLAIEWFFKGDQLARETPIKIKERLIQSWKWILLSAIILGGLLFLNTWDFPIYGFLLGFCFIMGFRFSQGFKSWRLQWKAPFTILMVGLGLSTFLYGPFLLTFQSQAGGILPNLIYPSRFQQIFVMFGPLIIPVVFFLLWLIKRVANVFSLKRAVLTGSAILFGLLGIVILLSSLSFVKLPADWIDSVAFPLKINEALSLLIQRRLVDSFTALFSAAIFGVCLTIIWGSDGAREKNMSKMR